MYYIVNDKNGKIIEIETELDAQKMQELADYFGCPLYAIVGEHSGYTARPTARPQKKAPDA